MTSADDLANYSRPITDLFPSSHDPVPYQLSAGQIASFHRDGFLAGIPVLNEQQIEVLKAELAELTEPDCEGCELFYEYHSNESEDPSKVLFHALGAWRIRSGFHDLLWHPAITVPASQLLEGRIRFWHDQLLSLIHI